MKKRILFFAFSLALIFTANAQPTELWGLVYQGRANGAIFKLDRDRNFEYIEGFGATDGRTPRYGKLAQASNGLLYGMTEFGGSFGLGVIFKYDPVAKVYTNIYEFENTNGAYPRGSLIVGADGKLYGMTSGGGSNNYGIIFSFDPATEIFGKIHDFDGPSGLGPQRSLMLASDGKFYGMTSGGGSNNYGVIFSYDINTSTYAKVHDFDNTNGRLPYGNLMQADDGKLYGLTQGGGSNQFGVIFSFDPTNNTFVKLYDFDNANGRAPYGDLIQAGNDKLYGMTKGGGAASAGVIFSYDIITDTYSKVLDFNGSNNGRGPEGSLTLATDGKLYGLTSAGGNNEDGVLFSYDINTGYSKLFTFANLDGEAPNGSLIQASDGKFYGMTQRGGSKNNAGTIFSYDPNASYNKEHDFDSTNGVSPTGSLLVVNDDQLYGMTVNGGDGGQGTIFKYDTTTDTYNQLHRFDGTNGRLPFGDLILVGKDLYGLTELGGIAEGGVLFTYNIDSDTYTKKYDFINIDGKGPVGALLQAADGKLYGMTRQGGTNSGGVIFSYDPTTDAYSKLYDFDEANGDWPYGNLIQASDNKLYGLTNTGGVNDEGVIFSYDLTTDTYTKLHEFDDVDGKSPFGSLIQADDGKLYGLTSEGGVDNRGVIFSYDINTATFTNVYDLSPTDGHLSRGALMQSLDGKLYGMSRRGGSNQYGTVFSFDIATNTFNKLHDFNDVDGQQPYFSSFVEIIVCPDINTDVSVSGTMLSAVQQSDATYQWINCDTDQEIVGADQRTYEAMASGNYAVQITIDGCISESICNEITTLDIQEAVFSDVQLYPNPTSGRFTLSLGYLEPTNIAVYSMSGQLVKQLPNQSNQEVELNVGNGIYILQISTIETSKELKLLINR